MEAPVKLNQLQILVAIAETGSINSAAERLGATQPALSKAIRALEAEAGVDLLVRHARGVTLTPAGEIVLKRAQVIGREIEKTQEELEWLKGAEGGQLSIGLTPIASELPVAHAVAALRKSKPLVRVDLSELRPRQILDGLQSGRYDVGLITLYGATAVPAFQSEIVRKVPVALVCGGPAPSGKSPEELFSREWVDYDPRDGGASYIGALAESVGAQPPANITHCTSLPLALDLALGLEAICTISQPGIPLLSLRPGLSQLRILNPSFDLPHMNVCIVFQEWERLSLAAKMFIGLLRHHSLSVGNMLDGALSVQGGNS